MRIDYIPHPFLISIVREAEGDNVESDFLLKAVRFTNTTGRSAEITRCAFDLTAEGKSQHRISCSEDNLRERSMSLLKYVEQSMIKKKRSHQRGSTRREYLQDLGNGHILEQGSIRHQQTETQSRDWIHA